jgi:hypothetical protein
MPKKTARKFSRKKTLVTYAIVAVVIIGAISYTLIHNDRTNVSSTKPKTLASSNIGRAPNPVNYGPSSPTDNTSNDARKSNPATASQTLDNGATSSGTTSNLSVTIIREGAVQPSGSSKEVQVTSQVSGATSGSCTLTLSQAGQQSITQTDTIQLESNAYGCAIFNIPVSQFPSQGQWNTNLSISSGNTTASTTGSVTI